MSRARTDLTQRSRAVPHRREQIAVSDSDFSVSMYDKLTATDDFDEPLRGLSTRELHDDVVFQHYFGTLP